VGVFGAVIGRQLLRRGPGVPTIFVAGAVVTVGAGAISLGGAELALAQSFPVLAFLFALFLFAAGLDRAGALDHLARWLTTRARRPEELPALVFVGFGIASAFLVNDALVVIGVPAVLSVARRLRASPVSLLLALAFGVTVGSALTPFGNPQNLLVVIGSGLRSPIVSFLRYLLLPIGLDLAVGAWYVHRILRTPEQVALPNAVEAVGPRLPLLPTGGWRERLSRDPAIVLFPGTMVVLLTLDLTAAAVHGPVVPSWEVAIAGAAVLLLASPGRTVLVRTVNWEILLLFAGLFVVVAGAVAGGVIGAITSLLPIPGPGRPIPGLIAITATSIGGPQLVSNVPWVALQIPILAHLGYGPATPVAWVTLAAVSTLAGNVTLLGAASNLIVVELGQKEGVTVSLATFVRYGLPLAGLTIGILLACVLVGL
jgi:Na+/H+ antiporter NhaD/arsenite permease-like protein